MALFVKARNACSSMRKLPKIDDHGKFVVPCLISGVEYIASPMIMGPRLVSYLSTLMRYWVLLHEFIS